MAVALAGIGLGSAGVLPGWAETPTLEQALGQFNPQLRALAARIEAAKAKVGPAGAWSDPKLKLEAMVMMDKIGPRAGVEQMVPVAGQPSLMAAMARLEVGMLEAERRERTRMLMAEARTALYDLAYVAATSRILDRNQDLIRRMSRVAEARYAVGKGMQADILRSHVAQTKLLEPRLTLANQQAKAKAILAALLPGYTPPTPSLTATRQLPSLSDLLARAETTSPMLAMRRIAIDHAQAGVELAARERWPDLMFELATGKQMPSDMPYVSAMATVPVPIWFGRKQAERLTEAEKRLEAEKAALVAAQRDVEARITSSVAMTQEMEGRLRLYRDGLVAQAQQGFQSAIAAYQVGMGDFLMILDSQMVLYDLEMAEAMAQTERLKMAAMIEALVGEPLVAGGNP